MAKTSPMAFQGKWLSKLHRNHSTFMFVEVKKKKRSSREFHLGQNQVQGGQGFHFNPLTKKKTPRQQYKRSPIPRETLAILLNSLILKIVSTVIPTHLKDNLRDQQKFMILTRFIHHDNSSTVHYEG